MGHATAFLFAIAVSLILTSVVRRISLKLNILDMPRESRWHRQPVALMGGVGIFTGFVLVTLLRVHLTRQVLVLLLGGGAIFALGLLDDLLGTHPGVKFSIQVVVALAVACFGVAIRILPYRWLNIALTTLWIVGLTNALNLLDNMDGLSSGITTVAALVILGLSLQRGEALAALLSSVLAGVCLGFLRYNFNPAKIFMGDCGSLFLGYMLAMLTVLGGWQHSSPLVVTLMPPILILGVPIFDTTLVTIVRLKNGRKPWQGGKDHSSHRLVSILGGNERGAMLILCGMGALVGGLGLIAAKLNSLTVVAMSLTLFLGMCVLGIMLARVECDGTGKAGKEI